MREYKYDYVRIPVTPEERAKLEAMVDAGEAPTVSKAAHKLIFRHEQTPIGVLTQGLGELAAADRALRDLLLRLPRKDEVVLYEADIIAMRKAVQLMERSMVSVMRAVRRRKDGSV